jgi:hypothetical protein
MSKEMKLPAHLKKLARGDGHKYSVPISGPSFPRISIAKERFTAIDADGTNVHLGNDDIEFVIVDSNPHLSKVYFGTGYDADAPSAPDCWSDNGRTPDVRVGRPQHDYCHSCPQNQWGSAINPQTQKQRKACGDFKKVLVYLFADDNGQGGGLHMLRVSGGSLKNWGNYTQRISSWKTDGSFQLEPHMVITRAFWSDKQNILDFENVDFASEGDHEAIEEAREDTKTDSWLGLDPQAAQLRDYSTATAARVPEERRIPPAKQEEPPKRTRSRSKPEDEPTDVESRPVKGRVKEDAAEEENPIAASRARARRQTNGGATARR